MISINKVKGLNLYQTPLAVFDIIVWAFTYLSPFTYAFHLNHFHLPPLVTKDEE